MGIGENAEGEGGDPVGEQVGGPENEADPAGDDALPEAPGEDEDDLQAQADQDK